MSDLNKILIKISEKLNNQPTCDVNKAYVDAELAKKQNTITDLETIREGAELGATAVQSETDPTVPAHVKAITENNIAAWNGKSDFDGDYNKLSNKLAAGNNITIDENNKINAIIEPGNVITIENYHQDTNTEPTGNLNGHVWFDTACKKVYVANEGQYEERFDFNSLVSNKQDTIDAEHPLSYSLLSDTPTAVTESTVEDWGFTKNTGTYSKPKGGIPNSDLSAGIQALLDKANTSVQTEEDPVFKASVAYNITSNNIRSWNAKSEFSGSYNDLTDKPEIPTVPTAVSAFINDAGYLKVHQSLADYSTTTQMNAAIADHHDDCKQDTIDVDNKLSYDLLDGAPQKVTELENDANYITETAIPSIKIGDNEYKKADGAITLPESLLNAQIGRSFTTNTQVGALSSGTVINATKTIADILYMMLVENPVSVTKINFADEFEEEDLAVGSDLVITVDSVEPSSATDTHITWTSSDNTVATITVLSADTWQAEVTAIKEGDTTITATASSGAYASGIIHVTAAQSSDDESQEIAVTSISLNKNNTELVVGNTEQLIATILPENATNKEVTWSSNNEDIVIVDEYGIIEAISAGSAAIIVENEDYSATCNVTVIEPVEVESISFANSYVQLNTADGQYEAAPIIYPENATDKTVTWSSSEPSVAIIDNNGVITFQGSGGGVTVITATSNSNNSISGQFVVEFVGSDYNAVNRVLLNKHNVVVTESYDEQLTTTIMPANAAIKAVDWNYTDADNLAIYTDENLCTIHNNNNADYTETTIKAIANNYKSDECTIQTVSQQSIDNGEGIVIYYGGLSSLDSINDQEIATLDSKYLANDDLNNNIDLNIYTGNLDYYNDHVSGDDISGQQYTVIIIPDKYDISEISYNEETLNDYSYSTLNNYNVYSLNSMDYTLLTGENGYKTYSVKINSEA